MCLAWHLSYRKHTVNRPLSKCVPRCQHQHHQESVTIAQSWSCPKPTESETLGVGPDSLCFNKICRWLWRMLSLRISAVPVVSVCLVAQFSSPWTEAHQMPLSMGFSRQEYRSESHSLLQGVFPTQGSNLGLLHCRQILYHLSHQESP